MSDEDYKYIYTKRRVYRLPKDARGIPIEEVYPGAEMPAMLKGALVYDTPRGRIIARQESDGRDGSADSEKAGSAQPDAIGKDTAKERLSEAAGHSEPAAKREPATPPENPMRFFARDASRTRTRQSDRDRDDFER